MQELWITTNPFDTTCWEINSVEDCRPFLFDYFNGQWPPTAKIFHKEVADGCDVTQQVQDNHECLAEMEGRIFVVVYPADPVTASIAVNLVAVAVLTAVTFIFRPDVPKSREQISTSPNNLLGRRTNIDRVNGRIPDIYGKVRAYPDLIQSPYRTFVKNVEVENLYVCIGRGEYSIDEDLVRDGDTPLNRISGASASFYGPDTSPNNDAPFLVIGDEITTPLVKIIRSNEVDGQLLPVQHRMDLPTAQQRFHKGPNASINFRAPDIIETSDFDIFGDAVGFSLANYFIAGEFVTVYNAFYEASTTADLDEAQTTSGSVNIDLSGTYKVAEIIDDDTVRLDNPGDVNPDWNEPFGVAIFRRIMNREQVLALPSFGYPSDNLDSLGFSCTRWIGPIIVGEEDTEEVWLNFFAPKGLFATDGANSFPARVEIEVELTPCDSDGDPTGSPVIFNGSDGAQFFMTGAPYRQTTTGITIKIECPVPGRQLVRAQVKEFAVRYDSSSWTPQFAGGSLVWRARIEDEVQWTDCYAVTKISPVQFPHFGNITTAQVEIFRTPESLAVKDRKFSCVVTRKLNKWNGATFDVTATATRESADAIIDMCTDVYIGRLQNSPFYGANEFVDLDGVKAAATTIQNYFASGNANNFDYTFDKSESSFEDLIATVANTCFMIAYRIGGQIKCVPDIATTLPSILCNHRNKIPGSETRKLDFSTFNDNDSVEVDYVDAESGVVSTYEAPLEPVFNPKDVDVTGLSTHAQAFWHGQRALAKIKHQNTTVEFEMTHEIAYVATKERILIADDTRDISTISPLSGEIVQVVGDVLTCSQPTDTLGVGSKFVFLQHDQGFVESVGCTTGPGTNEITLTFSPSFTINTDVNNGPRTKYIVSLFDDRIPKTFQLIEKVPTGPMTYNVKAINISPITYIGDNIRVWMEPENTDFLDAGPFQIAATGFGSPTVIFDSGSLRKRNDWVYSGNSAGDRIFYDNSITQTYTIGTWVLANPFSNTHSLIMSGGATRKVLLRITPGSGLLEGGHANSVDVSTVYPPDNTWHHVMLTYNAISGNMFLYLDGVLIDFNGSVPNHTAGGEGVSFGGTQASSAESLVGFLWHTRTWSRALSAEEVYDDFRVNKNR